MKIKFEIDATEEEWKDFFTALEKELKDAEETKKRFGQYLKESFSSICNIKQLIKEQIEDVGNRTSNASNR